MTLVATPSLGSIPTQQSVLPSSCSLTTQSSPVRLYSWAPTRKDRTGNRLTSEQLTVRRPDPGNPASRRVMMSQGPQMALYSVSTIKLRGSAPRKLVPLKSRSSRGSWHHPTIWWYTNYVELQAGLIPPRTSRPESLRPRQIENDWLWISPSLCSDSMSPGVIVLSLVRGLRPQMPSAILRCCLVEGSNRVTRAMAMYSPRPTPRPVTTSLAMQPARPATQKLLDLSAVEDL